MHIRLKRASTFRQACETGIALASPFHTSKAKPHLLGQEIGRETDGHRLLTSRKLLLANPFPLA
jgi:hypothetical protein